MTPIVSMVKAGANEDGSVHVSFAHGPRPILDPAKGQMTEMSFVDLQLPGDLAKSLGQELLNLTS